MSYPSNSPDLNFQTATVTNDVHGTYHALIDYHFIKDHPSEECPWQRLIRRGVHELGKNDKVFDEAELERVLNVMKKNKIPAPLGLPLEVGREIFEVNRMLFVCILHGWLKKVIFPPAWKTEKLVL